MTGPPRRRPFPFDCVIANQGLMLGREKPGAPLVATRTKTLAEVAPTAYQYDTQSPLVERVQPYDDLSLGFGQKVQQAYADRKYRYALNADLSVAGLWLKGPNVSTFEPATTDVVNGAGKFFELGGVLYVLIGRYALQRVSDGSWTVSNDFGSYSTPALDVAVFTSSGTGTTLALVALGDSANFWSFDGITWTQHASLKAGAFAVVGRELYRASDTNLVSQLDTNADPLDATASNVGNQFRVGDKSSPITALASSATGTLVVFKTDGVYTLDEAGHDAQLYPFLKFAPDAENGKYWGSFDNDLHVTYREGHFRLVTRFNFGRTRLLLEPIGPERMAENDSPVRGRLTAFVGHNSFHAYAGLHNPDTGDSYLLKFGSWVGPVGTTTRVEESKRLDAWHGALAVFPGQKITALYKTSIGAPGGHTRCYIGFGNGSLGWFTLPCVPNPAGCSQYTFTTTDGQVFLPLWHGTFLEDAKTLRAVSVLGLNLDASNFVQLQYKSDPSASSYTAFGIDFASTPRRRADFADNVSTFIADLQVVLKSGSPASCPQVTGVGLHHAVRPALVLEYAGAALAADGLVKRDGRPLRLGASAIRQAVKDAASALGSVTVILPDEQSKQLSFVDYGEALAWDERSRRWQAAVAWKAVEFRTNTPYGSVARLGAYTVADLSGTSVAQAGGL